MKNLKLSHSAESVKEATDPLGFSNIKNEGGVFEDIKKLSKS